MRTASQKLSFQSKLFTLALVPLRGVQSCIAKTPNVLLLRILVVTMAFLTVLTVHAQKFTLAKLSLEMSPEQAQLAIGPDLTFTRDKIFDTPNPIGMMVLSAWKPGSTIEYHAIFIQEKLVSFRFLASYPKGSGPTVQNAYASVAGKLWPPVMPPPSDPTQDVWLLDATGRPLRAPHRGYHTGSDVIDQCINGTVPNGPQELMPGPSRLPFNPTCGIRVVEQLMTSSQNRDIVETAAVFVVDEAALRRAAASMQEIAQQQGQQEKRNANQVKSPF